METHDLKRRHNRDLKHLEDKLEEALDQADDNK
jgi:hypothetical protein